MSLHQGTASEAAETLQQAFERQEAMLREVDHRAKNSIAMAVGLLRLQRQRSKAPLVNEALDQAIQRLCHLARLHDILSRQAISGSDRVDMQAYLAEVCDSFSPLLGEGVQIILHSDPLQLQASHAAPVALIVSEAISNAIKHAFPAGRAGVVRVTCSSERSSVVVAVEDNGVGKVAEASPGSLGVRLMTEMARSLGGVLSIQSEAGTRVSASFPLTSPAGVVEHARATHHPRRRGSPVREVTPTWREATLQ